MIDDQNKVTSVVLAVITWLQNKKSGVKTHSVFAYIEKQ